jgi:hypothetical protein
MSMLLRSLCCMVLLSLCNPTDAVGQSKAARGRANAAAQQQKALRAEGCGTCRVWVTGRESDSLHILDPEAATTANDYKSYPTFWCSAGFKSVTYYSRAALVSTARSYGVRRS